MFSCQLHLSLKATNIHRYNSLVCGIFRKKNILENSANKSQCYFILHRELSGHVHNNHEIVHRNLLFSSMKFNSRHFSLSSCLGCTATNKIQSSNQNHYHSETLSIEVSDKKPIVPIQNDPEHTQFNYSEVTSLNTKVNSPEITSPDPLAGQIIDSSNVTNDITSSIVNKGILASTSATGDAAIAAGSQLSNAANSADVYGWIAAYLKFFDTIASSTPVSQLMSMLRSVHETTGLPWWLSIVLTTVVLRTAVTVPLAIYQQHIVARLELLKAEMMDVMQHLSMKTKIAKKHYNWDEATAKLYFKKESRKEWQALVVRDNCHPAKSIVMLLGQLPLWLMISVSLRNLTTARPIPNQAALESYYQLAVEGLPWCINLTAPDPFYLLPVGMALVNLLHTEVNVLLRPQHTSVGMKRMNWVFRGAALIVLPIAIFMPSGVIVYWASSSACALAQTLVLALPAVRATFRVPLTPSAQAHPYARIMAILKDRRSGNPVNDPLLKPKEFPQLKKKNTQIKKHKKF